MYKTGTVLPSELTERTAEECIAARIKREQNVQNGSVRLHFFLPGRYHLIQEMEDRTLDNTNGFLKFRYYVASGEAKHLYDRTELFLSKVTLANGQEETLDLIAFVQSILNEAMWVQYLTTDGYMYNHKQPIEPLVQDGFFWTDLKAWQQQDWPALFKEGQNGNLVGHYVRMGLFDNTEREDMDLRVMNKVLDLSKQKRGSKPKSH